MKIVHFHPDGRMANRFVDPLVEAERKEGFDSSLVTSIRRSSTSDLIIPYDISLRNLFLLPVSFLQIYRLLKRGRPRVVISHNTKSSPLPLLAAWLVGVRTRVYFNHGVPYVGYKGVLRWLLRLFEYINCSLATSVVTVSLDMCKLIDNVSAYANPKIIFNGSACGIDLQVYCPDLYSGSVWRNVNKFSNEDLVVVFVGRPEKRKGFELVLRLWENYVKNSQIKLVLCGAEAKDVLCYLPAIPINISCLGFVDNIPEILSCADVLILPSYHEGLSYACMEAQACGALVVANNISGIRCIVENGVSGYLVSDNKIEKYAEILQEIYAKRASVVDVCKTARESTLRYSRALFIPAYLSFIRSLVSKE